jgi:hypothetical protein
MNLGRLFLTTFVACISLLGADEAAADPRAGQTTGMEAGPPTPMDVWLQRLVGNFTFEGLVQVVARGDCAPLPPDPAKQAQMSEAPPEPYCRTIKGKGDCVAIGKGPGVHCVLNVLWKEMYETVMQKVEAGADSVDTSPTGVFELPGGAPYLDPSMALFGLNPGNAQIDYLLVNNKGMPEGGPGSVAGNRATFRTGCVNEAALLAAMKQEDFNNRKPSTCERALHFDAKPDAKVLFITMNIDINEEVFTRFTMTMRRQVSAGKAAAAAAAPSKPAAR